MKREREREREREWKEKKKMNSNKNDPFSAYKNGGYTFTLHENPAYTYDPKNPFDPINIAIKEKKKLLGIQGPVSIKNVMHPGTCLHFWDAFPEPDEEDKKEHIEKDEEHIEKKEQEKEEEDKKDNKNKEHIEKKEHIQKDEPSGLECSICMVRSINRALIPCGHTFCSICVHKFKNHHQNMCPNCRIRIQNTQKIYI